MQTHLQEVARDARFDLRIPSALKEAVTYAAKLRGLNLSDFIIAAVADEAGRVINENHVIHVTLRDHQALLAALDAPAKAPTEKAIRAAKKYKKDVEHGRVVIQH